MGSITKKRREFEVFSLAFLDCICCGFGAVVLIFVLSVSQKRDKDKESVDSVRQRVQRMESQVSASKEDINRLSKLLAAAQLELPQLDAKNTQDELKLSDRKRQLLLMLQETGMLKDALANLLGQKKALPTEDHAPVPIPNIDRHQYLTGFKLEGECVLFLVRASGSMLDENIDDATARLSETDFKKREAPKWQRTLRSLQWMLASLDPESRFQILLYADDTVPLLPSRAEEWFSTTDRQAVSEIINKLNQIVPQGSANLERAFGSIRGLSRLPDSIVLFTDGLPTASDSYLSEGATNDEQRIRFFREAIKILPDRIPVSTILFPMTGDPAAPALYWARQPHAWISSESRKVLARYLNMRRRPTQVFSLAFLDCICCGFGAVILIFILSIGTQDFKSRKTIESLRAVLAAQMAALAKLKSSKEDLETTNQKVASLLTDARLKNDTIHALLDDLEQKLQNEKKGHEALLVDVDELKKEIAARQKNKPDMTLPDVKPLPVGVPVGSNYLAFVIDTSGSMRDFGTAQLWPIVIRKIEDVLNVYPTVDGIQVLDADGRFVMGERGGAQWMPDSAETREGIKRALRRYDVYSESNPVPGIYRALRTLYNPNSETMKMGIYIFCDEFNGTADPVLRRVDELNPADADGKRRVVINAIAFPTTIRYDINMGNTGLKVANLMRELCFRHGGAFIALQDL